MSKTSIPLVILLVFVVAVSTAAADGNVLFGTAGDDVLAGTAGPDTIYGRAGNDVINGGAGDDELDGGSGADVLAGGVGEDAVLYGGATPVSVSLDGVANDGRAGEGDNVARDVEDIYGGDGADTLTGNGGVNLIDGGAGNDRIVGGGGSDVLYGGDGDDTIDARDGAVDRIDCGAGDDTVIADASDVVTGCEHRSTGSAANAKSVPAFGWSLLSATGAKIRGMALTGLPAHATARVFCAQSCGRRSAHRTSSGGRATVTFTPLRVTTKSLLELDVTAKGYGKGRYDCIRFHIVHKRVSPYLKGRGTYAATDPVGSPHCKL